MSSKATTTNENASDNDPCIVDSEIFVQTPSAFSLLSDSLENKLISRLEVEDLLNDKLSEMECRLMGKIQGVFAKYDQRIQTLADEVKLLQDRCEPLFHGNEHLEKDQWQSEDPRQRPKSNLNELEANETLDEMIDTTIRGFDRIAKSLKKRPNLRNLANLPTDRDKLNEVLQHSIRQTESSLSLLRQGMQETLLEMSRILGKRTALQVPEIRNLVNDFEKRKCQRQGQLVECPREERPSSAPSTSQEKPAEGAEAIAPKEEEEAKEKEKEEEEGKEKEGEEEKEKEGE